MTPTDLLGAIAAALTTLAFLPQAILVLRTRDTAAISLTMYVLFLIGVAAWFAYGLLLGAWPVILANAVTFVLASLIFAVKVQNSLRARQS